MHITFQTQDISITAEEEQSIREQVDRNLQHFADHLGAINIYIRDINGPQGGKDISVVVRSRVRGRVELAASALRSRLLAATGAAARRAKRQVKRAIHRQQRFDRLSVAQSHKKLRASGTFNSQAER